MSYVSKYGFCPTCRPLLRRNSLIHRESTLHKQIRRLRALLAKDCVTYAEIGARLGISRERVRQLADEMGFPHIGRMRQTSCTTNRRMAAFLSLPFVQELARHHLHANPVETYSNLRFSTVQFSVNGKRVSLSKGCLHGRARKYLHIKRPQHDSDIYVWTLPNNDFLILPRQKATFKVTMFSRRQTLPGKNGYTNNRAHYYPRYINAWQIFRGRRPRNFA